MREIKFRFFDPTTKEMNYQEKLIHHHSIWISGIYYETLMECTGLKDKEDKELYEGDIVRCYEHKESFVGVVEFMHGMFGFRDKDSDFIELACWVTSLDILGNIYENPELLENKK